MKWMGQPVCGPCFGDSAGRPSSCEAGVRCALMVVGVRLRLCGAALLGSYLCLCYVILFYVFPVRRLHLPPELEPRE